MQLFQGTRADPGTFAARPDWIHPALVRFADECSAAFGHLILYVGTLVLLAVGGIQLCDRLPEAIENEPAVAASWAAAHRSFPALSVIERKLTDKTAAYGTARQPDGGKDGDGTDRADADAANWLTLTEKPGLRGGL